MFKAGDLRVPVRVSPAVRTTQTRLKSFGLEELLESDAIKVILDRVLESGIFMLM